jgi:hypothetical protein
MMLLRSGGDSMRRRKLLSIEKSWQRLYSNDEQGCVMRREMHWVGVVSLLLLVQNTLCMLHVVYNRYFIIHPSQAEASSAKVSLTLITLCTASGTTGHGFFFAS